tara:strand:+ start:185 stop:487 length:303 start_codon:yes stop_codon:yes gene_type:complete
MVVAQVDKVDKVALEELTQLPMVQLQFTMLVEVEDLVMTVVDQYQVALERVVKVAVVMVEEHKKIISLVELLRLTKVEAAVALIEDLVLQALVVAVVKVS